jgi:hypothetical protein
MEKLGREYHLLVEQWASSEAIFAERKTGPFRV